MSKRRRVRPESPSDPELSLIARLTALVESDRAENHRRFSELRRDLVDLGAYVHGLRTDGGGWDRAAEKPLDTRQPPPELREVFHVEHGGGSSPIERGTVERARPTVLAFSAAHDAAGELDKALEELASRLSPCLYPEPPAPANESSPPGTGVPGSSPVSMGIFELAFGMKRAAALVRSLTRRVEL